MPRRNCRYIVYDAVLPLSTNERPPLLDQNLCSQSHTRTHPLINDFIYYISHDNKLRSTFSITYPFVSFVTGLLLPNFSERRQFN